MLISVVIPTKDRPTDLLRCIESIRTQTYLPDEVIVVDASNNPEAFLSIPLGSPWLYRYFYSAPGLTHQRNVGIEKSFGDIVLFLDDDVILEKHFIEEIMGVFKQDKTHEIGGCMGTILNTESATLTLSMFIRKFLFLSMPGNGKFRLSGFPTHIHHNPHHGYVECLSGGLTAYRRRVFADFLFDEALTGYCAMEDDDFSRRVSQKYKLFYEPAAKCVHNNSANGRDSLQKTRKMLVQNHHYLFHKNFPQDFKHKTAFFLSLIGLILQMIYRRKPSGLWGTLQGISSVFLSRKSAVCS